jgi:hypothetical protein
MDKPETGDKSISYCVFPSRSLSVICQTQLCFICSALLGATAGILSTVIAALFPTSPARLARALGQVGKGNVTVVGDGAGHGDGDQEGDCDSEELHGGGVAVVVVC